MIFILVYWVLFIYYCSIYNYIELIITTSKLVVCKHLEGSLTGSAPRRGLFIFAYLFLVPINGSIYSLIVIWSFAKSSFNWSLCIMLLPFCFDRLYQHSILCTRTFVLRTYNFKFACWSNIIKLLPPWDIP